MRGITYNRIFIKNIGMLMGLLTGCVVLFYTALSLDIVLLGGDVDVVLRLLGVVILSIVAYVPYYFLYKLIGIVRYTIIFIGMGIGFFIGNIILLVWLVVNLPHSSGLLGLILYSLLFVTILLIVGICDKFISWCISSKNICYKIRLDIIKNIETLLNEKKI